MQKFQHGEDQGWKRLDHAWMEAVGETLPGVSLMFFIRVVLMADNFLHWLAASVIYHMKNYIFQVMINVVGSAAFRGGCAAADLMMGMIFEHLERNLAP